MMKEAPKPNLRAFHEQSKAKRALFSNCEAADEVTAAHIRKMLSEPDPILKDAEAAAERGDVDELLMWLDNTQELAFVADNIAWLKALGKYEHALLNAYTDTRLNLAGWQLSVLRFLFRIADRPALLAAGDPLPGPGAFTVFRGVAGTGAKRRLRGISWTADRDKAIWFAKRFVATGLAGPAVFQTEIEAARVYAYTNGRSEQEFLCDVEGCKLRKVWTD
jgi:hypothetical protein